MIKYNNCSVCDINLKGWIYYQKGEFKICHFRYEGLEIKGENK